MSVSKAVVCIDDFERKGAKLEARDVLGLISSLKEFKACKVCLILNEDALGEDSSDFRKYLEKVVDVFLKFEPSATECVDIAFPGATGTLKVLAESCVALAISNIRLIKRIERSVRKVEPMLNGFDVQILRQAVQSLALLGWAVYEPNRAPSLDYLLERRGAEHQVRAANLMRSRGTLCVLCAVATGASVMLVTSDCGAENARSLDCESSFASER